MAGNCPVCESELRKSESRSDLEYFECLRCGPFALTGSARAVLSATHHREKKTLAKISHVIQKMGRSNSWPTISTEVLKSILENTELPRPTEQLNNLVMWLGTVQVDPGSRIHPVPRAISAVGAIDLCGLGFVVAEAARAGLVESNVRFMPDGGGEACLISPMQLTMRGWQLFDDLARGRVSSRVAFMAMPFGMHDMDEFYKDRLRPAVAATGFTLKRLDEAQPAGLIDDRLRVEIRQSRFLISDLTHRNAGAYWEAGYAEGLGKPVIYTCRKDVFDDKKTTPHFDTNHHLTVVWDPARMDVAMAKLRDTIRATLPDEAVLED